MIITLDRVAVLIQPAVPPKGHQSAPHKLNCGTHWAPVQVVFEVCRWPLCPLPFGIRMRPLASTTSSLVRSLIMVT